MFLHRIFAAEVQACTAGLQEIPGRAERRFGWDFERGQAEAKLRDFGPASKLHALEGSGDRLSAWLPDPRPTTPFGVSCALKAARERRRLGTGTGPRPEEKRSRPHRP